MTYDDWLTTPPDTDECTNEPETCPCPICVEWRENREPDDDDDPSHATKDGHS